MKRFMGIFAATAVVTSVAFPGIASAHSNNSSCLDGKNMNSYSASITRGSGTISVKGALCENTDLVLESFNVPDSWNGKGFNSTAIPQTKFAATSFTIPAGQANFSKTVKVDTPEACKNTQLDFYVAPAYEAINGLHDDDGRYIAGVLFKGTDKCETTPPPTTPEETPVYKCEALKVVKADRTSFSFTTTASLTSAKLKNVVYTVKNSDRKVIDTITRNDLKSVDYQQKTTGKYSVSAVVNVTVNGKDAVAEGTCEGTFEVVADTTPSQPTTPTKTVPVQEAPKAPAALPNTGASSMIATFVGVTILGTVAAYIRQRFARD